MTTRALNADEVELLSRWRAVALQRMPYFSTLLFETVPFSSDGLDTMGVDGKWRLYINFDKCAARGDLWCAEALLHECGHLFLQHLDRARDAGIIKNGRFIRPELGTLSNLAGDAEWNDDLVEAGCSTIASDAITPDKLGLPDHEIYEFYLKKLREQTGEQGNKPNPGDGDDNDDDDDGDGPTTAGCGSGAGGAPLDAEFTDGSEGDVANPGKDASERDAAMQSAAVEISNAAKQRGDVPAGLCAAAEGKLVPPQVSWQQVMKALVRQGARPRPGDDDSTFSRRRRRPLPTLASGGRIVLPGTVSYAPYGVVIRDTSGSMSDADLNYVNSEVVAISEQCGIKGKDLIVADADAAVARVASYTGRRMLNEVHGRGGTDMASAIDQMCQVRPRPNFVVCLTDGYTGYPARRPAGVKVIIALVGPADQLDGLAAQVPSWASVVKVDTGKFAQAR